MIVYLSRVIPAFVMYCVNGASTSSLLIESTDSMILLTQLSIVKIYLFTVNNAENKLLSTISNTEISDCYRMPYTKMCL